MNSLYFVAINTPDSVSQQVREIQREFAERFESNRQLRIPVHITIIPPFKFEDSQIDRFRSSLRAFAAAQKRFEVQLKDFGSFRQRTIYVAVRRSKELDSLYSQVHRWLEDDIQFIPPIKHPVFHPHVTVANRDLKDVQFVKAWKEFENRLFQGEFIVDQLVILKHNGQVWEVLEELPFAQ